MHIQTLTLYSANVIMPHRIIWRWYVGLWWVGCNIRYSNEGPGHSPPNPSPSCTKCNSSPIYQSPYCCIMISCSAVVMYQLQN